MSDYLTVEGATDELVSMTKMHRHGIVISSNRELEDQLAISMEPHAKRRVLTIVCFVTLPLRCPADGNTVLGTPAAAPADLSLRPPP